MTQAEPETDQERHFTILDQFSGNIIYSGDMIRIYGMPGKKDKIQV